MDLPQIVTLGEAGIPHDDATYGGTSDSLISLDYFREKYREFQVTLNALDEAYQAGVRTYWLPISDENKTELDSMLTDYENRRDTLRMTAEAMNAGAAVVNWAGGRMPVISIPQTLGIAPALPIAAVIAVSTAATLIVWGQDFTRRLFDFLKTRLVLESAATPEQRQELAHAVVKAQQAVQIAESSSLGAFGGVAQIVKWGAIALGAFLVYKAVAPRLQGRSSNPPDDDDSSFVTGDGDGDDAEPGEE